MEKIYECYDSNTFDVGAIATSSNRKYTITCTIYKPSGSTAFSLFPDGTDIKDDRNSICIFNAKGEILSAIDDSCWYKNQCTDEDGFDGDSKELEQYDSDCEEICRTITGKVIYTHLGKPTYELLANGERKYFKGDRL